MTSNEGNSIVNAAVAILLVLIVIGCVMALLFVSRDRYTHWYEQQERARDTANTEALYNLYVHGNSGRTANIPVKSVEQIIRNYNAGDLYYIYVKVTKTTGATEQHYYTFGDYTAPGHTTDEQNMWNGMYSSTGGDNCMSVDYLDICADFLRDYGEYYCTLNINTDNNTAPFINVSIDESNRVGTIHD